MPGERINTARRNLLRGRTRAEPVPPRPPYAANASVIDACTRCGACVAACPEGIVVRGDGGFPEVDFSRGECTFCADCAHACPAPVFDLTALRPWDLLAVIGEGCLTKQGVVCQSCREACPERAITFQFASGRVPRPFVETASCTGCGACVSRCPADAIAVTGATADA
jgi:ferredoxin-type protein NapF